MIPELEPVKQGHIFVIVSPAPTNQIITDRRQQKPSTDQISKTENKGTVPQKPDECGYIATLLLTSYRTQSRLMSPKYIKLRETVRLEQTGNSSIFIYLFSILVI